VRQRDLQSAKEASGEFIHVIAVAVQKMEDNLQGPAWLQAVFEGKERPEDLLLHYPLQGEEAFAALQSNRNAILMEIRAR